MLALGALRAGVLSEPAGRASTKRWDVFVSDPLRIRMRAETGNSGDVVVPAGILKSGRGVLSAQAVGIYFYIATRRYFNPNWIARDTDIVRAFSNGTFSVREAIKELIRYGYVNRVQVRGGGRIIEWRMEFYDCPQDNPHFQPNESGQREEMYIVEHLENFEGISPDHKKKMRSNMVGRYKKIYAALIERDGYACKMCGRTDCELQIDHIFPVSRGGTNGMANLQLLCRKCNATKGAKVLGEW